MSVYGTVSVMLILEIFLGSALCEISSGRSRKIFVLLECYFDVSFRIFLETILTNILKSNNELYILHSVLSSITMEVREY